MRLRQGVPYILVALAVCGGAALGFTLYESGRTRGDMARAQAAAEGGDLPRARDILTRVLERHPNHDAAAVGLAQLELRLGRPDRAIEAWMRVPEDSPWFTEAAVARARAAIDLGRFTPAEEALVAALRLPGSHRREARRHLSWLYRFEGRHDEVRKVLEEGLDDSDLPAEVLRELWQLDHDAYPIEGITSVLDRARDKSPDDPRVALGLANLALQRGDLTDADRRLSALEKAAPTDPVVARARLNAAIRGDDPAAVVSAAARIPVDRTTPAEGFAVRAWLATHSSDRKSERAALDAWLAVDPANTAALERRAALATEDDGAAAADPYRKRKAEIDRAKERFRALLANGSVDPTPNAAQLAELAAVLGRRFESRAWAVVNLKAHPGDPEARALHRKLTAERTPTPPAGARTLADLIGPPPPSTRPRNAPVPEATGLAFVDRARESGLDFTFDNGRSPIRQLPETMSGGIALLDFDGDGRLDVYCVQGGPFPPRDSAEQPSDRLFRNTGGGRFVDATAVAGIDRIPRGYGHGVTVGDIDNDGDPDLFLTRWNGYRLLQNDRGKFVDVTDEFGLGGPRDWPTSAAFADLDNDGDLDLYVCHYLQWDADSPRPCRRPDNNEYMYCTPRNFPALPDHLFRNDGARFVDVTKEAGIVDNDGRGLGVVAADVDGDGKFDLFVANDMSANYLFRNLGGMKFQEVAESAGCAAGSDGGYQAGMGTACADYDGDGRLDLAVTNFYAEGTTLYRNLGGGLFVDRSGELGLKSATRGVLGFGLALADFDLDGRLDVVQANGHVNHLKGFFPYEMPAQLIRQDTRGRFTDLGASAGRDWTIPRVGRGLAVGDLNDDGRLDVLILSQNSPLAYLHNESNSAGHGLVLSLRGTKSNRDAVGAVVTVRVGDRTRIAPRVGGGSYQSANDGRMVIGLGSADVADEVSVRWPTGAVESFGRLTSGYSRLTEGSGRAEPIVLPVQDR